MIILIWWFDILDDFVLKWKWKWIRDWSGCLSLKCSYCNFIALVCYVSSSGHLPTSCSILSSSQVIQLLGIMGRRLFQKFVRAGRDGRPWRAAGMDFWNKRHGFLSPIVAEVRQSGPWTAGRDGPLGWTFETNGTDSWRRLLQKFARAGRGRPAVTGRRNGLLKQTARIPGADCCRSPSERAVAAGRGRPAVTGRRGLTFETNGTDSWRRLLQKFVRAGRGRPAVTGRRGLTFETNGTDSWRRLFQKSVRSGRGGGPSTAGRDGHSSPRPWPYQRDAIPTQLAHKAVFTSLCTGSNIHLNDREADTPVLP